MAIITISRGTFAGGEKLATALAERLGYAVVSREHIYSTAEELYGIRQDELADFLEQAPTLQAMGAGRREDRQSFAERRRRLFTAVQAALCEHVQEDKVVYHGHAGHLLLPGISHVLRIRLVAPRALRIELAMAREGLTRHAAGQKIDQVDGERARWNQALFGVNWREPLLFDMVLNLENLAVEEMTDIVERAAHLRRFQPTDASMKAMRDLALSSKVAASLLSNPAASSLHFEVVADGGAVRLAGLARGHDSEWLYQAIGKIAGVKTVV